MTNLKQEEILRREFGALGFDVIYWNEKPTKNGVDCYVQKHKNRPLSVEIKRVKRNKETKALSVDPIGKNRQSDDLIAIIVNDEYVLIEPMDQHLKCCGPKGYRPLSLLK